MKRLSIIIVTQNRSGTLATTLDRLVENAALPHDSMRVIVIDNASTDDTVAMLRARRDLPIRIISRPTNEGVSARNYGFKLAHSEYILLIDDDSYPIDDAVERSLAYLDQHPHTAAVVGQVRLLNGDTEASALPSVMANGAVCIRKQVIDEVGGLPREFFRQAEEYDHSFRIWNAGYKIERFDDLVYIHEKVPGNRQPRIVHRYDLRNNLILIERYLPREYRAAYRADWIQRYTAFARSEKCQSSIRRARFDGALWRLREKCKGRQTLSPEAFENVFQHQAQTKAIRNWKKAHQIQTVVLAEFSKNIFATYQACKRSKVDMLGLYDPKPAFKHCQYRDLPITDSISDRADGIVLSNVNPAQIRSAVHRIKQVSDRPILVFWEPRNCPVASSDSTEKCEPITSPIAVVKNQRRILGAAS